jgi:hypothetical protein
VQAWQCLHSILFDMIFSMGMSSFLKSLLKIELVCALVTSVLLLFRKAWVVSGLLYGILAAVLFLTPRGDKEEVQPHPPCPLWGTSSLMHVTPELCHLNLYLLMTPFASQFQLQLP